MIQTDKLKQLYNLDDNFLYKNSLISIFANKFLSSTQSSKYQLFHKYIFRSDNIKKYIEEHYFYKLENDKFSWKNKKIQKEINEWATIFVGFTKFPKIKNYCELFLSFHTIDNLNYCTGFSVNTNEPIYEYIFDNSIDLGYTHFKQPVEIDKELTINIKKFAKSIK